MGSRIACVVLVGLVVGACAAGEPEPAPKPPGTASSVVPSTTAPTSSVAPPSERGGFGLPPITYPTVAGIDFARFPSASGARGGREVVVRGSLTDAVRAAQRGDTLVLEDGDHPIEDADCGCGLLFATDHVTLRARHPGKAVLHPGPGAYDAIQVTADDVTLEGLDVRSPKNSTILVGRLDRPTRGTVLRHMTVEAGSDGIRSRVPEGPRPGEPPIIEGMLVEDTSVRSTKDTQGLVSCGEGPCTDLRFRGVTLKMDRVPGEDTSSGADALAVERGDNVLIEGADVTGAPADGIDLKATRAAVVNSHVHDVARNGVKLWRGGDVVNTLIEHTGGDAGLVFEESGTYRLAHSVVRFHAPAGGAYAATVGYDATFTGSVEIVSSAFTDNGGALYVGAGFDLRCRNSFFVRSAEQQLLTWARPTERTATPDGGFGLFGQASTGCAATDPHLGPDGRAEAGAPVVDAGAVVDGLGFDASGGPRRKGAAPDIGPFEA